MPQLKQKGRSSSGAGLRAVLPGLSVRSPGCAPARCAPSGGGRAGRQGYFLSHSWPFFFHHRHDSRHQYSVTMKASFS